MSEIKRRSKDETRSDETGGKPPRRQGRVTLTKDVSSKYRKIMPKDSPGGKFGPKAPRRKSAEEGSAPRPPRPRSAGEGEGGFGSRPPRPRSGGFSQDREEGSRPPRPRHSDNFREREGGFASRSPRPRSGGFSQDREEGSRPPRPRHSENFREREGGAPRSFRPRSGEGFREREGGEAPRSFRPRPAAPRGRGDGRPPARRTFGSSPAAGKPPFRRPGEFRPRPGGDSRPPLGPDAALVAITNRELPEAATQLKETQQLILSAATEMLVLTERLESINKRLEGALLEALSEHSLLEDSLLPLVAETAQARSAVVALYEKMCFQDLAGQRLMKVQDFLNALGRVLGGPRQAPAPKKFAKDFSPRNHGQNNGHGKDESSGKSERYSKGEKSELKGPAAPGDGLVQIDIDQILNEL